VLAVATLPPYRLIAGPAVIEFAGTREASLGQSHLWCGRRSNHARCATDRSVFLQSRSGRREQKETLWRGRANSENLNAMTPIPVTVVVPVKNEEKNLPACLAKLGHFAEILIVDSSSTDRTREVAEAANVKVINFTWHGGFPKKRNWVLLNYKFMTHWVLFLDADEQLTDAFLQEINARIASDRFDGYWLNYRNHFLGRVLKYGVPQRKLALFRVGGGLYEKIDDANWSELDMEVHEHPIIQGAIGEINAPIDHLDFRGIHHFIDRHNSYSTWEANRYLQLNTIPKDARRLSRRQLAKYRYIARWWFPLAYFMLAYIVRGGFLDGRAGFIYALFKAYYFLQIREKIAELNVQRS
jgi:glycosyltransferase involved in cell wall biosynthesis